MDPVLVQHNVQAVCPDCRTVTTFEHRSAQAEYGFIAKDVARPVEGVTYPRTIFFLARCAGCGRGGMAEVAAGNSATTGKLMSFVPTAVLAAKLPAGVPTDLANEVAEAEVCAAAGAYRAASGMLRSALEKTLKANGFTKVSALTSMGPLLLRSIPPGVLA